MPCPKCNNLGTSFTNEGNSWVPFPQGVEYSCNKCGFRLYGQKAIDRVKEYTEKMEPQKTDPKRNLLLQSVQEQEAKRRASARARELELRTNLMKIREEKAVSKPPLAVQPIVEVPANLKVVELPVVELPVVELPVVELPVVGPVRGIILVEGPTESLRKEEKVKVRKPLTEGQKARKRELERIRSAEKKAARIRSAEKKDSAPVAENISEESAPQELPVFTEVEVPVEEVEVPVEEVEVPVEEVEIPVAKCAWEACEQLARSNSMYCSRKCSTHRAHQREALRKKAAKESRKIS